MRALLLLHLRERLNELLTEQLTGTSLVNIRRQPFPQKSLLPLKVESHNQVHFFGGKHSIVIFQKMHVINILISNIHNINGIS